MDIAAAWWCINGLWEIHCGQSITIGRWERITFNIPDRGTSSSSDTRACLGYTDSLTHESQFGSQRGVRYRRIGGEAGGSIRCRRVAHGNLTSRWRNRNRRIQGICSELIRVWGQCQQREKQKNCSWAIKERHAML